MKASLSKEEYEEILIQVQNGIPVSRAAGSNRRRIAFIRIKSKKDKGLPYLPWLQDEVLEKIRRRVLPVSTAPVTSSDLSPVSSGETSLAEPPPVVLPDGLSAELSDLVADVAKEDIPTEKLLFLAKKALARILQKPNPPPSYLSLVLKLCELTLPDFAQNRPSHKDGVNEYKNILSDLLQEPVEKFSIIKGKDAIEPERNVANG